jgi:toluene monooxygenase system ferredoxin subunit
MNWSKAEGMGNLWDGEMRSCRLEGRRVLVLKQDGAVRAYEDKCAHLGVPMSEGRFEGGVLTCRAHEYQYDADTGMGINPRAARLKSYPAKLEGGDVWVDVTAEIP